MIAIATHGANFHSDDIFAVATLLLKFEKDGYSQTSKNPEKKIKVIRTLDSDVYNKADFVVDIGGVYDVRKKRFDHHQVGGAGARENGVPYASFGLVWKSYGKELTGSTYAADWVDRHAVQGIDGMDSGKFLYTPTVADAHPFLFQDYFATACDVVKAGIKTGGSKAQSDAQFDAQAGVRANKSFDKEFMRLVVVAKDVLRVFITKSTQKEAIKKIAAKAYAKAKDKRVIISDAFIPTRFEDFKAPEYIEPLVFVYPDLRGGWSAKVVPKGEQSYEARMLFPENWRGKKGADLEEASGVKGAVFCHNSGFLAVADTKEGALELVAKAIK